jgi:hypothetical protein
MRKLYAAEMAHNVWSRLRKIYVVETLHYSCNVSLLALALASVSLLLKPLPPLRAVAGGTGEGGQMMWQVEA